MKNKNCKQCRDDFSPVEVRRSLGKESSVYLGGFCSARCYTKYILKQNKQLEITQLFDDAQNAINTLNRVMAELKHKTKED